MSDFLPEYTFLPIDDRYRPAYRLFVGSTLHMVPGVEPQDSATKAVAVAKAYVRAKLNPPIRSEQFEAETDVLGLDEWRLKKAGQAAEEAQATLGSIVVRGREIKVEKRRMTA